MSNIIDTLEKEGMKQNLPELAIGDQVKVFVKVKEGDKERLQSYEGTIIAFKNGGIRETVTVRRVTYGVGVERTFPIHSPKIDRIEVVDMVRSAEQNFIISVREQVRLQNSRKLDKEQNNEEKDNLYLRISASFRTSTFCIYGM